MGYLQARLSAMLMTSKGSTEISDWREKHCDMGELIICTVIAGEKQQKIQHKEMRYITQLKTFGIIRESFL